MIFEIDSNYAKSIQGAALSDLCCKMMEYGHYIDCDGRTFALITQSIRDNASTTQLDCFKKFKGFSLSGCLTRELRTYLTTINVDGNAYSLDDLERIICKESCVLLENGPYEWEVYKTMMSVYQRDRQYGNLFQLLVLARNKGFLVSLNCGGYGMVKPMIEQQEKGAYENVFSEKSCIVFDRDTDDEVSFDSNKNALFQLFCNKKSDAVTDQDVYTLVQSPYHWHMWYKREIENYLTDNHFKEIGVDTSNFPSNLQQRDYFKITPENASGYNKAKLPLIAKKMSKADYDSMGIKSFFINGVNMSEIQLFLLKLVKII